MLKAIFLSFVLILLGGCSTHISTEVSSSENYIQKSFEMKKDINTINGIALKKIAIAGLFINGAFSDQTLIWAFGPNVAISKDNLTIQIYNEGSTLFEGFGIKDRLDFFIYQNLNIKSNLNKRIEKLGFQSSVEMFEIITDRIANSTEVDFYFLVKSLNDKNINISAISPQQLSNMFFAPYRKYGVNHGYLNKNGYKIQSTIEDFYVYAASLSVIIEMVNKNIRRDELYGL